MDGPNEPPTGGEQVAGERPTGDPFGESRHTGGKKGAKKPAPDLKAMRKIVKEGEPKNPTPFEAKLWKLHQENFEGFMRLYRQAERDHKAGGKPKETQQARQGVIERDEGTEKCLAMLDEWIAEWHRKNGGGK